MRKLVRIGVIVGVLGSTGFVVPSAMAWQYAGGTCQDASSTANFGTYYTLSSGYNRVDMFEWSLDNPNGLGNKNNVNIQHKKNVSGAPDVILWQWTSPDSVPAGYDTKSPNTVVQTKDGVSAHTRFAFAFDNNGADDHCNADTNNFS